MPTQKLGGGTVKWGEQGEVRFMGACELHAQASLWRERRGRSAVILMEGRTRHHADGLLVDALHRVVLARGLRLTTDLSHRDPRPVPGWQLHVDHDRAVTIHWSRMQPLLDHAPLDLPAGWLREAVGAGRITLIVGYGLGLHEAAHGTHLPCRLDSAARDGRVAAGVLHLRVTEPDSLEIPAPRTTTITTAEPVLGNSHRAQDLPSLTH